MMRSIWAAMLVFGSAQAAAQDKPRIQADQYLCLLEGKCVEPANAPVKKGQVILTPVPEAPPIAPAPPFPGARMIAPPIAMRGAAVAVSAFALATAGPQVNLRIGFPSGSSTLGSAARAELRSLATAMTHPVMTTRRFRIEGHTDSAGSAALNRRLSQARADSVRAYLAQRGVARARLVAAGFAFDRPLPGRSASYAGNRRVEAVLLK